MKFARAFGETEITRGGSALLDLRRRIKPKRLTEISIIGQNEIIGKSEFARLLVLLKQKSTGSGHARSVR